MLVSAKEMLNKAKAGHYAVGGLQRSDPQGCAKHCFRS